MATIPSHSHQDTEVQGVDAAQVGALAWTGERLVPTESGQTAVEHLHRYALATDLARDKIVLDIASGEGYGANLLAQVAEQVVGVDIAHDAVAHARAKYCRNNLTFAMGECAKIPLKTSSVDLVVSFETIEHHGDHEEMAAEFARVLRPDGALIISSPNRYEYSDLPKYKNPFHVAELYRDQFEALLRTHFRNVCLFGQRVSAGSYVAPLQPPAEGLDIAYQTYTGGFTLIQNHPGIDRPVYFIAVASNGRLPAIPGGLFEGESFLLRQKDQVIVDLNDHVRTLQAQLAEKEQHNKRLQAFSDAVRQTWAYHFYRKFIKPLRSQ